MLKQYLNKIIEADCLDLMKKLPVNSIDMVLTSPPYDNLRDYKGFNFSFELIAQELFRIIKKGGVLVQFKVVNQEQVLSKLFILRTLASIYMTQ